MKSVFISRLFPQRTVKLIKDAGFLVDMWNSDDPIDYNQMVIKCKNIDGLVCTLSDQINENFINSAGNLKVISTMSVGYDHIDLVTAQKRHIRVGYTPNVLTDATAELAVALLLSVSRRIIEGVYIVKNGTWGAWKPYWMCGYGLKDSIVGIVGFGNIGRAIAQRIQPFSPKSLITCGSERPDAPKTYKVNNFTVDRVSFDELLRRSDFIIVSCSLNDKTRNLFDEIAFGKMKKNAIFVNISRGPVVDQEALYRALFEGKISGAGLDVCTPEPLPKDHPLLKLSNCVILPHLGSATVDTRSLMCEVAVENVIKGLQGGEMTSELKF